MGLMLRYYLFHDVTAPAIYGMLQNFYAARGRPLKLSGTIDEQIDVHQANNGWVVVTLDSGWEWKERREAQLYVSRRLVCAGFLIFVHDGDYWGDEFFNHGMVLDQFVQESGDAHFYFADRPSQGNPGLVAEYLPFLHEADVAAYLVQSQDWQIPEGTNTKARSGDEYDRFDECAVLDFLRMLGVQVGVENGYAQLTSPCYRSLWKEHKR